MSAAAVVVTTAVAAPAHADQSCGNGFTVGGRIEQEYVYLGGAAALGSCSTRELNAARNGKFQEFQNDGAGGKTTIYWNSAVANGYAKMVRGEIYKTWAFYNWEQGALGYPTISEAQLATRGGKYNTFEGGSVYYSPDTGAHAVFGAIRDKWAAANYEKGTYGYPVSDEYELDGGIEQLFEGGPIKYNVGEQTDGDPNDTNTQFGKDDPRFVALGRFDSDFPKPAAECHATNVPGEKLCARIGSSTETNDDDDPPVDARSRNTPAPDPSTPSPTTSPTAPSGAPQSTQPSESSPPESSPASTPPTSPSVDAPATSAPSSAATSASTTAVPRAAHEQSDGNKPSFGTAFSRGNEPRIVLVDDPKPGLGGVTPPADPSRDFPGERAYFSSDTDCKGNPPLSEKQYAGRFYSCAVLPYTVQLTGKERNDQGEVVDVNRYWSKGYIYTKQKADAKSLSTDVAIKVVERITAGPARSVTMRVGFSVDGGSITGDYVQDNPLSSSPEYRVQAVMAPLSASNMVTKMRPAFRYAFAQGDFDEGDFNRIDPIKLKEIRCDSMVYIPGSGCVMAPGVGFSGKPVMDLGAQFFPNQTIEVYRNHILHAVNSFVPGNLNTPFLGSLTRIEYRSRQAANNRVKACAPARTKPFKPSPTSSWQCDEFPFASTAQGANSDPDGKRTFDFCKLPNAYADIFPDGRTRFGGYSSCIIPAAQNRAGGSIIPTFNRKNRLLFAPDRVGNDPIDGFMVYPYP